MVMTVKAVVKKAMLLAAVKAKVKLVMKCTRPLARAALKRIGQSPLNTLLEP